jgi:betaine-aldehyde dehydrogenase
MTTDIGTDTKIEHWIGGEFDQSGGEGVSLNPATGEQIGTYADGDAATMRAAIDAAEAVFLAGGWAEDHMLRSAALSHLADAFVAARQELIGTLMLENGKLRAEAAREVTHVDRGLRFAAGLAAQPYGRVLDPRPGVQAMVLRQPKGVVGIIVPFNAPVVLCLRSVQPALAAGCTVVIKMPGNAARTAGALSRVFASVPEIPAGVINVVVESGSAGAEELVSSPRVPVISFTGSTAVGRRIYEAAAANYKTVGLELGGKNAHLIFDDADLDAALPVLVQSSTAFAGQFCHAGARILVHEAVADRLTAALVERLEAVKPGPAADPESEIGPLIDKRSVTRVDKLVGEAIDQGARALVRGGPIAEGPLAAGAFYRPALLAIDDPQMEIAQAETFGPVQTLQTFDTEDEAVELANATEFGLSASVWSRDPDRPLRIARRLEVGLVSINSWANLNMEFEEGGWKASGVGRLHGLSGIDDFLEYKQIGQNFSGAPRSISD